ncbi:MAG: hypothetical protein FWD76_03315 [Firmicutes bacterium]|nr:hypothetical protein [Bacillota bacterium]
MAETKHILTLDEALVAVKRDNDNLGEIEQLLAEIDAIIEAGIGLAWQDQDTIPPLAKSVARLMLQIEVGLVTNPMYQSAVSSRMFSLQMLALKLTEQG